MSYNGDAAKWHEEELVLEGYALTRENPHPKRHHDGQNESISQGSKRSRDAPPYSSWDWDFINPKLAGKLKHEGLREFAEREQFGWASRPLEQLHPGFRPELRDPPPTKEEIPRVSTASWLSWLSILPLLGVLFKRAPAHGHRSARCGLFGVPKALKRLLRVIFDARPANAILKPRSDQLVLFTLAMLVSTVLQFRCVATVDYRHYYYQFPLPEQLAWFFLVVVDGVKLLPRVLPMGFREAVTIAQAASWMVVLFRKDGEDTLGVDVDALRRSAVMPPFISLWRDGREVGRILVLLDGVLVACDDPALTAQWEDRLRRNEDEFHVVRKENASADLRTPGSSIEFAGVVFDFFGWRPRAELPTHPLAQTTWLARSLAGRLGSVLWVLRLRGALQPGHRGPLQFPRLMKLYRELGRARTWTATDCVHISEADARYLDQLEAVLRAAPRASSWPVVDPRPVRSKVYLLATDAYPRGLGMVCFTSDGCVRLARHRHLPVKTPQVVAEALAVAWALELMCLLDGCDTVSAVVAVDADTVRVAVNKGYARSPALQEVLRRIYARASWLEACRVPGVDNAADRPSRGSLSLDETCQ